MLIFLASGQHSTELANWCFPAFAQPNLDCLIWIVQIFRGNKTENQKSNLFLVFYAGQYYKTFKKTM